MVAATINKKTFSINFRWRSKKASKKKPFERNHAIENAIAQQKQREIIERAKRSKEFIRHFY